ncbi:MAG: pantoate--beta-alanine ligase [Chloroflexi bacterium]|nr:pantoate--beta-alanine ligase [Chloroflexota bacterium]
MQVFSTVAEFRQACTQAKRPLGLVPTMGALHAGHTALIRRSVDECKTTAATLFVNPAQFGPKEDFNSYPRNVQADMGTFEHEGVNLLFTPSTDEVYPPDFDTWVHAGKLSERLEGEFRPGHFRGVATVVCKLLSIARPDKAYFGQKDVQQTLVIKRINTDLNLGADIVVVPTVREPDGLALSSRNVKLNPDERRVATVLYNALSLAKEAVANGATDAGAIRAAMEELLRKEPLAQMDYATITDASTLEQLDAISRPALALIAARIGKTRLIDNMPLYP